MTTFSRRRLLRTAATAAGLAAGASLLPPSLHAAMAAPIRRGGLDAIEHVVVLMQENRSFDHYFGTLRGVRGFGDRDPLRLRSGGTVFDQPAAGRGPIRPFSVRDAAVAAGRPGSDIQYIGDLNHDFTGTTDAWGRGWNDGWIAAKTPATMTFYDRRDIPLQYELADTFTFCDAYHCSVFGSTNPNRTYLWTGTTGVEPGTTDRAVTNAAYDYDHPGYDWTTYPERLQAAGVSWQIFQEWDNFTDNPVEYFRPFKEIGRAILAAVPRRFRTTEEFYDVVNAAPAAERGPLLEQFAAGLARLSPAQRSLFDRAMYRSEPETLVARLRRDIAAGTLPAVSWLVPSSVDSEHPSASTPVGSANLVHDVLDALAADPDTWSRTVLFLNFDENDGFFDHVPPPVQPRPASGDDTDWFRGRPIGLGPRVPMTVVSPWTIGGFVDSHVNDHTSVLRFLERWTGVAEPNISAWRRSVTGDLTTAFDFRTPGRPPRLARPGPVPAPISRWRPDAPARGDLPAQESGVRPARSLPYRIAATVSPDPAGLRLRLTQDGAQGAPVVLYPFGAAEPQHAVLGTLDQVVAAAGVGVQGPNRFWIDAAGTRSGVEVGVLPQRFTVDVTLRATGSAPVAVVVRDRRSTVSRPTTVRPGGTVRLPWPTLGGWYDLEVTCPAEPGWRRRFTGRVENGLPGVTG